MAAFAYVGLPVTGLIAYFTGSNPRTRFHGLQAIAIGALWPIALYLASAVSPGTTQVVYLIGALMWMGFFVAALLGRDPRLPMVWRFIDRAARGSPTDAPRSTSGT